MKTNNIKIWNDMIDWRQEKIKKLQDEIKEIEGKLKKLLPKEIKKGEEHDE